MGGGGCGHIRHGILARAGVVVTSSTNANNWATTCRTMRYSFQSLLAPNQAVHVSYSPLPFLLLHKDVPCCAGVNLIAMWSQSLKWLPRRVVVEGR